jgi:ATP adenylyltransferase
MKTIWAPWRIEYILSKKGPECVFCDIYKESRDRENLILYRGELNYVVMNRYPYTGGHLMVVPYHHASSLEGLTHETLSEMMAIAKLSVDCLAEVMRPEGFNTAPAHARRTALGGGLKLHGRAGRGQGNPRTPPGDV